MTKKKKIHIDNGVLRIDNEGLTKTSFEIYYNNGNPIILIQEDKKSLTYSMDKYDFECLKEFLK